MRFEILELAGYNKAAAEILVDAVADNETKFKLLNKVWPFIVGTTSATDKASQFKGVVGSLYSFTGDDPVKYQLLEKTLDRVMNTAIQLQERVQTAIDEAEKLLPIVQVTTK